MKNLTWTCEACGEKRPDDFISVLSYPLKDLPGAERNLKYCNDKDSCYWIVKNKAQTEKI